MPPPRVLFSTYIPNRVVAQFVDWMPQAVPRMVLGTITVLVMGLNSVTNDKCGTFSFRVKLNFRRTFIWNALRDIRKYLK